jgi:NAD(P)-dependent dehydrogenase (short-subunit alcohol dehydrogenase family)
VTSRRLAVVTGGAGGIGSAICAGLLAADFSVVNLDRAGSALPDVMNLDVDLGNSEGVEAVASQVLRDFGRCDVLIHAAADFSRGGIDDLDLAIWRRVQAVNVESLLVLAHAFSPGMVERGFGRIVSVVSDTVYAPPVGELLAYVASKAALIGVTRSLAVDLGPGGVSVTAVAPGLTDTEAAREGMPPAAFRDVASRQTLGRPLVPGDVASAVMFLVSDAAAAMTGQTLCVDGGLVPR